MGKLKNALIAEQENIDALHRVYQNSLKTHPQLLGLPDTDEAWAQYEAEFNDWLDKFEASFGDENGYLP